MPGLTADAGGRDFRALDLPDAEVFLYPAFFSAPEADRLLRELRDTTAWRQETIKLYGKNIDMPAPDRLVRRRGHPLRLLRDQRTCRSRGLPPSWRSSGRWSPRPASSSTASC